MKQTMIVNVNQDWLKMLEMWSLFIFFILFKTAKKYGHLDAARLLEGFGDKTNWKEVFQQRDNDKVLQLFRFSRDSIAFQAMVKQVLTENQELRALIMTIKIDIIKILLEQGQLDMLLIILEGLELKADDLNELDSDQGRPSILWQACDSEHTKLAAYLLRLYGSNAPSALDKRAPDGTTAFLIALAKLNVHLVKTLADISSHDWKRVAIQC